MADPQNGQFTTQTVDGMQVPRSHFNRMIDFAFQGYFGMIERQARISAQPREIGRWVRTESWYEESGFETETGAQTIVTRHSASWTTSIVYDTSWAVNFSVISFQSNRVQERPRRTLNKDETDVLRSAINSIIDNRTLNGKKCASFLTRLLENLDGSFSTSLVAIFDEIAKKNGFSEVDFKKLNQVARGEAVGTVGGNAPIIDLPKELVGNLTNEDVLLIIHEVIHAASKTDRFSHYSMAMAARSAIKSLKVSSTRNFVKEPENPLLIENLKRTEELDALASSDFAEALKEQCLPEKNTK